MFGRGLKLAWLADGNRVTIPSLSLGEQLEVKRRDVQRLRELDLTNDTPTEIRERILDVADTSVIADALFMRLQKADPNLTMDAFETNVPNRFALLELVARVGELDGPKARWSPARIMRWLLPRARATGDPTKKKSMNKPPTLQGWHY